MERPLQVPTQAISRRTLLRGTVALSLGAIVAGCGDSGKASPSSSSPDRAAGDDAQALDREPIEVWRDPG